MNIFTWEETNRTGIEKIDNQHKHLVSLLNEVYAIAATNGDRNRISGILTELQDYTIYHFTEEEDIMRFYKYPFLDDHAALHSSLARELANHIEAFSENPEGELVPLLGFLVDWLLEHITETDKNNFANMKKDTTLT